MNEIDFIGSDISSEHIIYAVLELLNNSLRAHKDKQIEEPILLKFRVCPTGFEICIQDWGGGFDISGLPYDLYSDPAEIDIHSNSFESYRINNNYQRFGLGLYLAKKTFPYFTLNFFDTQKQEIQWSPDTAAGTQIRLRTFIGDFTYMDPSETEGIYEKQENI